MPGFADFLGQFVAPDEGGGGATPPFNTGPTAPPLGPAVTEAANSTPMDYRGMLGPILEAVAAEARRKADPINRLYDIGGAIHNSVASGEPFQKSMLAMDQARQQAIAGAGNLFLNMLGHEERLAQLKQTGAFQNAQIANMEAQRALQSRQLDIQENEVVPVKITTPSGAEKIVLLRKRAGTIEIVNPNAINAPTTSTPRAEPAQSAEGPRAEAPLNPTLDRPVDQLIEEAARGPKFVQGKQVPGSTAPTPEQRAETLPANIPPPEKGGAPPGDLKGKQLLDWLAKNPDYGPQYAATLRAVGDYDQGISGTVSRMAVGPRLHFRGLLDQYRADTGGFDETRFPQIQQSRKTFEPGGKDYANITNLRQVMPHMETFTRAVDALKNNDVQLFNRITNTVRAQFGYSEPTNVYQAARVLGLEAMRIFRQVNASKEEAAEFAKDLSNKRSPEQLAGVAGQLYEQVGARFTAHKEAYKQATRTPSFPEGKPFEFLPGEIGKSAQRVEKWLQERNGIPLPPEAINDPTQRERGRVYRTPRGPLRWNGTGWERP